MSTHDGTKGPSYQELIADGVDQVAWKTPDGMEHFARLSGGRVHGNALVLEAPDGERYGMWLFKREPVAYPLEYLTAEGRVARVEGPATASGEHEALVSEVTDSKPVEDGDIPAPPVPPEERERLLGVIAAAPELRDALAWAVDIIGADYSMSRDQAVLDRLAAARALLARLPKEGG